MNSSFSNGEVSTKPGQLHLARLDEICLPGYEIPVPDEARGAPNEGLLGVVAAPRVMRTTEAHIEPWLEGVYPDVLLRDAEGNSLHVEIVVTHGVDAAKYRKLVERGLATLAIALSRADENLTPAELETKLRDDLKSKSWVFHPNEAEARTAVEEALRVVRKAERASEAAARSAAEAVATERRERALRQTLDAMDTAIRESDGTVTREQMEVFREAFRRISRFHQWPTLGEYRAHVVRLKVEAVEQAAEAVKARARAEQEKVATDEVLYRRMKGD